MHSQPTDHTTEIIYVGDPMCSWCYGFSDELTQFNTQNSDIPFSIIVGGLRSSGDQPWNTDFKTFLRAHWEEINQRTGIPFSYDLLEADNFDYNTEPSCRAVVVASDMNPDNSLDFFKAIQRKFYYKNKDPKTVEFYKSICDELGYSFETFSTHFNSEEYRKKTQAEYQKARSLGIRSFPSVVVRHGDDYYLIGQGYTSAEELQARFESAQRAQE